MVYRSFYRLFVGLGFKVWFQGLCFMSLGRAVSGINSVRGASLGCLWFEVSGSKFEVSVRARGR